MPRDTSAARNSGGGLADAAPATTIDELISRRLLWPIADAAAALGISAKTLRRREIAGKLRVIRVGRKRYLSADELRRFVANLEHEAAS